MKYKVKLDIKARKAIRRLDNASKTMILQYIDKNLKNTENPKNSQWKLLKGKKYKGKGRYKIGRYRLLAQIKEEEIVIYIFEVGHRREIYR